MTDQQDDPRPRMVGLNHIALEIGNVDEALAFYGKIFDIRLRGRMEGAAFLDMGDQFLALMEGPARAPASHRHFGLVVDDKSKIRALAQSAGATMLEGRFLDFLDPWGNRVEIVGYADIQFTKTDAVLRGMQLHLHKSDKAIGELKAKGMAA